ncbi:MAG TPA: 16S rRNA (guanine(966)-N(2))-methyltransferase RsmD [Desulfotomaculum sp.]|jgi:16S rRNA (guanine(966)-N(2))-methyltransferase RsmD|nr:16S rRNA (guanine(966)-N(2))-methyltransferase RsmD [Desulfotomaculum sp.]
MVRVIAGAAKGRHLKVPRNWPGRPTGDRIKEALFNILGQEVSGSRFLDLYAGTGNVGIEAISRGATQVYFVEQDRRAVRTIYDNLYSLSLVSSACVIKQNVFTALKLLSNRNDRFNLIFLDPPYENCLELPTIEMISEYGLLVPGGVIIAESSKREVLPSRVSNLMLGRQERYGDTLLTFYSSLD